MTTALLLGALVCGRELVAQTIAVDASSTAQQISGFGGQIWAGDANGHTAIEQLGGRYVRLHHGVNFYSFPQQPPADDNNDPNDNFSAMKSYIAANFNGPGGSEPWHLPSIIDSHNWAQSNGIDFILNEFQIAHSFLDSNNVIMPANRIDDFATFWAAMVSYLDDNGVRPAYLELANEPNGTWNGLISPGSYNTLVKDARAALDAVGFSDVGILGPGVNVLGDTSWVDGLDTDAVDALAGWSAHAWDDYLGIDQQAQAFQDAFEAKDPEKPVFITEYATTRTDYDGVNYGSPDSGGAAANQAGFGVEVFRNTLSLVNHGAGALVIWESADQSWSNLTWGLKRQNGSDRPALRAMQTLTERLPEGASALEPNWDDGLLTVAGFRKDNELIVAIANDTDSQLSQTLRVDNAGGMLSFLEGEQYQNNATSPVDYTISGSQFVVNLPAMSTQTLVLSITPVLGDYTGDGRVDQEDFDLWVATFGSTTNLAADGNGDGVVGAADYSIWRDNLAASAAAIPEPTNLGMLLACCLIFLFGMGRGSDWRLEETADGR